MGVSRDAGRRQDSRHSRAATNAVRRALTNRTTTTGSGRCAESEAAAILTKVTVGQYVKLQVWTNRDRDASFVEFD